VDVCLSLDTARECSPHFAVTVNENVVLLRENRLSRTTLLIYEYVRVLPPAKLELKNMLLVYFMHNINPNEG
jgi:hypothetical protein